MNYRSSRNAFTIDDVEFLSIDDAANFYGVNPGTVRSRLCRGWSLRESLTIEERIHNEDLKKIASKHGVSVLSFKKKLLRRNRRTCKWLGVKTLPDDMQFGLFYSATYLTQLCSGILDRDDILAPHGHRFLLDYKVPIRFFYHQSNPSHFKVIAKVFDISVFEGIISKTGKFVLSPNSLVLKSCYDFNSAELEALEELTIGCLRDDIESLLDDFKSLVE